MGIPCLRQNKVYEIKNHALKSEMGVCTALF